MRFIRVIIVGLLVILSSQHLCELAFAGGPYREYEVLMEDFMELVNEYPDKMDYEVVGKTVNFNDMIMFRIGNSSNAPVLFTSAIHGWETQGSEVLYMYAKWLLTSNDTVANHILANTLTLLIPAVNVDNYNYDRENANEVDLNRNFATNWERAGSNDPESEWYRGPAPLSEPESQVLISVFEILKPNFYVDLHFPGGPYYAGSYYGDKSQYDTLVSKIESLSGQMGVTPYEYRGEFRASGLAFSDAAANFGITSFLLELTGGEVISLLKVETEVFPRFLPVAIVLSRQNLAEVNEVNEDPSLNYYEIIEGMSQYPEFIQNPPEMIPEFPNTINIAGLVTVLVVIIYCLKRFQRL